MHCSLLEPINENENANLKKRKITHLSLSLSLSSILCTQQLCTFLHSMSLIMPLNASRSSVADQSLNYRGVCSAKKDSTFKAQIKHVSKPRSWSKTKQLSSHCLSSRRSAALHKQEKCCLVISKRSATPKVSCHLRAHKSSHLGVPLCQNKSTPCNQFHTLQLTHLHRGVTRSTSALLPARWLPLWHGMRLLSH
jgi:hypothetical protein